MVLWRPTRPSRTNTKKRHPFHHRRLECKSRKSRDTWSNRQVWARKHEAGQKLTEFCQENTLVIANAVFQQHKRWPYTWTSPDGQYQNQVDYIHCSWGWRSCIQSAKQDQELTVAQIMNSPGRVVTKEQSRSCNAFSGLTLKLQIHNFLRIYRSVLLKGRRILYRTWIPRSNCHWTPT